MDHRYLSSSYKFPEEVVPSSMCFDLELVTSFLASCTAILLSSETGMHGITTSDNMEHYTRLRNNTPFITSASVTYSASAVERVTHFCVLEN